MQAVMRHTDLGGRSGQVGGITAVATPDLELQHLVVCGHSCGRVSFFDMRTWGETRVVHQGKPMF